MADPKDEILRALKAGPFAVPSAAPGGGLPPAVPFKPTAPRWSEAPVVPNWETAPVVGTGTPAAPQMTRFEIQTPNGKTYEVDAPDQEAALAAVKELEGRTPAPGYSEEQEAAIKAARERRATEGAAIPATPGTGQFKPEQQAALESAQARRKAQGAASGGMPFVVNPSAVPEPPSQGLVPGGMGAAGVRNPETGAMGGMGLFTPGRMTIDQARSELSETWKNPPAPISQSRAGVVSGAQAVTFGLADEIVGGMLALHPRIDYDDARDYLRAEVDDAREYFPKTALASEVGASLLVPGGAAAKFINKGTSTLGRMARAGLAGGTSGAAYGFGSGEGGVEERAWNALGSGVLGTLGGGTLVGLGQGFNRGLQAISRRPELRELAPTLEGLRDEASRLYTEARESGALLPGSAVKDMVTGIQSKLRENGYDPDLHPRLRAVLNRLDGETGDKTLAEVEILRRVAGNAAESLAPDERRLAGQIIDKIDDTIAGIPEGGDAMKAARETWGRLRRMELIDTAMERASLAKADFSTALQGEFRALAKNARKLRGFSDAERTAISAIARGEPLTTGLQALGNALNPRSTLGALLTGGAAYAAGPGALAMPVTSFATRKIADALSRRAGQNVRDNVGRSDANRKLIEALMRRANPLAPAAPTTGLLATLLAGQ